MAVVVVLTIVFRGLSASAESRISATLDVLNGFTQYQIDIEDGAGNPWGRSLLEFPLSNAFLGLNYSQPILTGWEFKGSVSKNVTEDAGALEDSDWIYIYEESGWLFLDDHAGKDIYSESDLSLDNGWIGHFNVLLDETREGPAFFRPSIGYMYERFNFTGSNVNQVGYGHWAPNTASVPGPALTYEVIYSLPYVGLGYGSTVSAVEFIFNVLYSPIASARDEDHHLLRNKKSTGTSSGQAFVTSGSAEYPFGESSRIIAALNYTTIHTEGTQDQYFSDGSTARGIPLTLDSEQWRFNLAHEWRF